ncbi:peptidase U32 family protein [Clostridium sp. HCP1S3_B4]|uniref:peptidase U32 family protein n=1 Tax=unclassified Clostridium TaxID=2614128 RepID=UPI002A793CBC|nr:U32 family peptidase [Clostridiales bacterium]MDY2730325.1 U32 family peptidase [Clostridium sp.]
MKKPEILAPAGNLDKLKTAIDFGADAVYLGGSKLNLRAFADNFTNEEIEEGVKYAHDRGRKVYVTLNVIPHNEDFEGLSEYVKELYKLKVDAVLVSDPGILAVCKEAAPELEIHLSTQANNVNWRSAKFWHDLGVKRIVLARELSLKEIREIREKLPESCDLEAFVHGAMCVSYSGRCLLSNYMIGRDSNRGACAQPCRFNYYLVEEKRPGEYYQIKEDEHGSYIMNSKDLCMIEHIDEVIEAGVYSLKIEGRMKSNFYVAAVVKAYRQAVDAYLASPKDYKFKKEWMDNLNKVSHRIYSTGFYYGDEDRQIYDSSAYTRTADIVGMVKEFDEENMVATIEQKNKVFDNDTVEVLRPVGDNFEVTLSDMRENDGTKIDSAPRPQMLFKVKVNVPLKVKDIIIKNI